MGRRSLISMTTINKLISASNRRAREEQASQLIEAQKNIQKELPPSFSIKNIEFNEETRNAKIIFLQKNQYRTITRYVTQNYVKHPIYSDWKYKYKEINKTVKLTNKELEYLNFNSDPLICRFANEIIAALNNEELFPSWFIRYFLEKEYKEKVMNWDEEKENYHNKINLKIIGFRNRIKLNKTDIEETKKIQNKFFHENDKIKRKIEKINKSKKSFFLGLVTFFIYTYLNSNKRKQHLENKQSEIEKCITNLNTALIQKQEDITYCENEINLLNQDYSNKKLELEEKRKSEFAIYSQKLKSIQPLPYDVKNNESFIPLKSFSGLTYEKIIGCYIIHNKEKDKYYVGQSKDVIRRIKQHFKGTIPNNIIFAEDYYSTKYEKKEDLFEIKIIPCASKDDLDSTEKKYIEKYNSFINGYNGTNGNT